MTRMLPFCCCFARRRICAGADERSLPRAFNLRITCWVYTNGKSAKGVRRAGSVAWNGASSKIAACRERQPVSSLCAIKRFSVLSTRP